MTGHNNKQLLVCQAEEGLLIGVDGKNGYSYATR